MNQKTRFKIFGNIGYRFQLLVHEWLIYWYQLKKSHTG